MVFDFQLLCDCGCYYSSPVPVEEDWSVSTTSQYSERSGEQLVRLVVPRSASISGSLSFIEVDQEVFSSPNPVAHTISYILYKYTIAKGREPWQLHRAH